MFFYMPTKVFCESNCVANHKEELAGLGSRAFIITGRHSSKKNGSLDDVRSALKEMGVPCLVFDGIEENPSVETVMKARKIGLEAGADFVVGIGGGSPLDAAKAIALMMKHPDENEDFLYRKGSDEAYPVAAVPTTCGTGSEATPWAILTRHELRIKGSISHKIFPALALSDPTYLRSAPASVLVSTSVDAMGHCIESYINTKATDYTRMLCEKSLSLWSKGKDVLLGEREASEGDLQNMMNASTLAGMAISHTGTSLPHGLSYYLTYEDGIPHGKAVGIFQTPYLEAADESMRQPVLDTMGFSCMQEFKHFMDALLGKTEIPVHIRERAVGEMLKNQAKLVNCPYPVDEEVMRGFF